MSLSADDLAALEQLVERVVERCLERRARPGPRRAAPGEVTTATRERAKSRALGELQRQGLLGRRGPGHAGGR